MAVSQPQRVRSAPAPGGVRRVFNKVPEITIFFWIIKILATTVGETAADFLNDNLNLGSTNTTYVMGALLVVALVFQFRAPKYVPGIYWVTVVLISVVGTLITDKVHDDLGVGLLTTTIAFAIALAVTFAVWYASEKTLSIHSIHSVKREAFYWSAILFTFALGTAAGDYLAETAKLGYWKSALLFAAMIGLVALAFGLSGMNAVLAFWIGYILTRPLGASLGDYLSHKRADGGIGLGTVGTTFLFLGTILAVVAYLTVSRKDQSIDEEPIPVPA